MRKRQSPVTGHIMRRRRIKNIITTGKISRKRCRGRTREKDGPTWWHQKKKKSQIELTENIKKWELWTTMTASAYRHGTWWWCCRQNKHKAHIWSINKKKPFIFTMKTNKYATGTDNRTPILLKTQCGLQK